jgi:hypothetical protein
MRARTHKKYANKLHAYATTKQHCTDTQTDTDTDTHTHSHSHARTLEKRKKKHKNVNKSIEYAFPPIVTITTHKNHKNGG